MRYAPNRIRRFLLRLNATYNEPVEIDIVAVEGLEEHKPDFVKELNPGEEYALGTAMALDGALATDDFNARPLAEERGVPIVESLGILGRDRRRLAMWVDDYGYFSPVESITQTPFRVKLVCPGW